MESRAQRELLASRGDAWGFVAEPYHFADWWPGVAAVEPDRRGLAPGARWRLRGAEPTLFRRAHGQALLIVREVEPPRRFAFHLVQDRLDAELELADAGPGRTLATLRVRTPFWTLGFRRGVARDALGRLHALCQTAAAF